MWVLGILIILVILVTGYGIPDRLRALRGSAKGSRDRLLYGEKLSAARSLFSHDGRFELRMQREDGNLVLYRPDGSTQTTDTVGTGHANYLVMQEDGNVVLCADNGRPLRAAGTEGKHGRCLILKDDGSLVLYKWLGRAVERDVMAALKPCQQ